MRAVVINFFHLEILNLHPVVYWGLAAVWFLLLVSAFVSVRSLTNAVAKLAWFLAILALPVVGLAAYALRCLFTANWQVLAPLFQSRRLDRHISPLAPSGKSVTKA